MNIWLTRLIIFWVGGVLGRMGYLCRKHLSFIDCCFVLNIYFL